MTRQKLLERGRWEMLNLWLGGLTFGVALIVVALSFCAFIQLWKASALLSNDKMLLYILFIEY